MRKSIGPINQKVVALLFSIYCSVITDMEAVQKAFLQY